jgi:hypothetical protein
MPVVIDVQVYRAVDVLDVVGLIASVQVFQCHPPPMTGEVGIANSQIPLPRGYPKLEFVRATSRESKQRHT